jgi:tubulin polyglutamylase TTLL6/13
MEQNGTDTEAVEARIEDVIRLTVISVQPLLEMNYRTAVPWHNGKPRCFEVLRFDILVDKRALARLLEVN